MEKKKLDSTRVPLMSIGGFNAADRPKYQKLLQKFGYKPFRHIEDDAVLIEPNFGYCTFKDEDDKWWYEEIVKTDYCPDFITRANDNPALFFALAALRDETDLWQIFLNNKEIINQIEETIIFKNTPFISFYDKIADKDDSINLIFRCAKASDFHKATSLELRDVLKEPMEQKDILAAYLHNVVAFPNEDEVVENVLNEKTEQSKTSITAFISLPISGKEEEAMYVAKEIKTWLITHMEGIEVVTPFEICGNNLSKPYHWYMGKDIEKLLQCDVVIQADGWENSKGCRCEAMTADIYGIKRVAFDDLIKSMNVTGDGLYIWKISGLDCIEENVPLTHWRDLFTVDKIFFDRHDAQSAYKELTETITNKVETAISENSAMIAKSFVLQPDANKVFDTNNDISAIDYYRNNLFSFDVEGADKMVYRCQLIPLITKLKRNSLNQLTEID